MRRCNEEICSHGAKCSRHGGELRCSCEGICVDPVTSQLDLMTSSESEVCGSDGATYRSECQLLIKSCQTKTHILITSYAACGGGELENISNHQKNSLAS